MTRSAQLAVLAVTMLAAGTAAAQTVAYRHRSTVLGDHLAGASELVRARGAFLRDEAAAAEQWVRVAAAQDDLKYQRAEHRFQSLQMELQYKQQKLENKLARREAEKAAEQESTRQLLESARHGAAQWPVALTRPEYAGSMSLVESILQTWSPEGFAGGEVYRKALATEAGVLRTRVANNLSIPFASRVEAVKTLRQLQDLASMPMPAEAGARLAMR